MFNEGVYTIGGDQDIYALEVYIKANYPLVPPAGKRITVLRPRADEPIGRPAA